MANDQDSTCDDARNQALAQVASICEMIAAYDVDYDRLEELRDEYENLIFDVSLADQDSEEKLGAEKALRDWEAENGEELAELESAAGGCKDQDDAETRIQEDALCVEYRSDWVSPGDDMTPSEFRILLCTGGPHVEIMGELDHSGDPLRCWIVYKDWGTSGELTGANFDHDTVLRYCGFFVTGY